MTPPGSTQEKISQAPRTTREARRTGAPEAPWRRSTRLWPLLGLAVVLAAVLPHFAALDFDFVWDDKVMIGPVLDISGPADLVRLWQIPFDTLLRDPLLHNAYFRPLTVLSLAVDRAFYGANPAGFHVTNLIVYAVSCVFLWLFVWELTGRALLSAAGAIVFALHPTHPESVDFIAGRTDVICGAFLFASLWAAARWGPLVKRPMAKLVPSGALLLLALWTKEVAVFASFLPLLVLWVRDRRLGARMLAPSAVPLLAALAVYVVSRVSVLGPPTLPAASPVEGTVPQLLTTVALIAHYMPLLFVPVKLSARHEVAPITHPDAFFAAGLAILIGTAVGAIVLIRKRSPWSIPLLLLASTLFPLCYARIISGALLAERFLFLPSASLALGVALLPAAAGLTLAGLFGSFFLVMLLPRVAIWRDDPTLYGSMLRDSPRSAYVHAVLGSYYYQARDLPRAIEHHRRAFELEPRYNESLLNLSAAEDELGQTDSAFAHVRLLLQIRPTYAAGWYALGNLFVRVDRPDSAIAAYQESIRQDPRFAHAENNLGVVLERMGRTDEALAHYRRALTLLPEFPEAANNIARVTQGTKPPSGSRSGSGIKP